MDAIFMLLAFAMFPAVYLTIKKSIYYFIQLEAWNTKGAFIPRLIPYWFLVASRSKIVFENAIQSCLHSTLPEHLAKARILRARARLQVGQVFGANEDLQAALVVDPDNPEAKALLHQRSVAVEKVECLLIACISFF